MPPILGTLLVTLGNAAIQELIGSDELAKWLTLGMGVFRSGLNVEARLRALEAQLRDRLERGAHFGAADFDAIAAEIAGRDQAWADL